MLALYLTIFILIVSYDKYDIHPLIKSIFPICNFSHKSGRRIGDFEIISDIFIHSIFITSYLWSIGIIKIILL
jgi:hypothetical protein